MDYYIKEFDKLQEEFHEVMHNYPLFNEDIKKIQDKDIKELNELLSKNDEYYFKKAISKLKDLIYYVKDTSTKIKNEYSKFDKLAKEWDTIRLINVSESELANINDKVRKANELIKKHDLNSLIEANKIMERLIKDNK